MPKLILVTGGARSGKSTFAEQKAKTFGGNVLYIATSKPLDEEMEERIKKHRAQRPSEWETLEAYKDFDRMLPGLLNGKSAVLLDCITIMVTNIMFDECLEWEKLSRQNVNNIERTVQAQMEKLIAISEKAEVPFILVTNEVGMGVVPPSAVGRDFRDIAGRMNQILTGAADEVYLCVSGLPVKIK